MRPEFRKNFSLFAMGIGLAVMFYWRDLGLTVFLLGLVNYVLYRRNSSWTVV
jgi:hypothetical protein